MTFIEFFDPVATENICSCLTMTPDRVVYIGDSRKQLEKHIAIYSRFFADRGQSIEFLYRTVSKCELEPAIALLQELVDTYDDCVFDVTGGEEALLLALGVVYARNPDKNIQIHKFNLRKNSLYDWDMDGATVFQDVPMLSVAENIRLYGGEMVYGGVGENKTYLWDLTADFVSDVELMWSLCRDDIRMWNNQITVFDAIRETGTAEADFAAFSADIDVVSHHLQRNGACYRETELITLLQRYGLMTSYKQEGSVIRVAFKDGQVARCLTKAGQALEMKVFLTMKNLPDKNGKLKYNDAVNGAYIDWDGAFHDEETEKIYDTENEIDVLLMQGAIPVFVSCKNGIFDTEELYKLNTVAERFGGPYAEKVLVTTRLSSMGDAGAYLRQRAADMKIRIISDVQDMDDAAFIKALKNL